MSNIVSLGKETLIYGLSYSLGRVINFLLITSYLTYRVFEKEDGFFSIYQDLYFYIGLFLGILTLRMETVYFRFVSDPQYKELIYPLASRLIWIVSGLFLFIIITFRSPILDWMKYGSSLSLHLLMACFILVLDVIVSLPFAKIRYDKKPIRYAWIKLTGLLMNVILVLGIFEGIKFWLESGSLSELSSERKLLYVLMANLLASFLTTLLLFPEILQAIKKVDWSPLKKMFSYTWPLIVVTLSFTIIQSGYTSYLKYLLSDDVKANLMATDSLNAAFRLAVIMNLFLTAFNYAAEPFFFRHASNTNAKQHFADLSYVFILCCSVIYLVTCLNLNLFSLLLGTNYRASMHLVPVLLMGNIFSGLYYNLSAWNKLTDKTLMAAGISFSGLVLNTVLYILLIPMLGLDASAWILLVVYFWMCAWSYFQGQKHYPIPYQLIPMFLNLSFVALIAWIFQNYNFGSQTISLVLGNLICFIFIFYTYRMIRKSINQSQ
ncbi:MAG: hypothetical protein IPH93_08450 [Saprospiraceae bacterium]|nr:hypothetical protein [Saprospiraceae bacterium]